MRDNKIGQNEKQYLSLPGEQIKSGMPEVSLSCKKIKLVLSVTLSGSKCPSQRGADDRKNDQNIQKV